MRVLLNDGMDKEGVQLFEEAGIETDTEKKDQKTLIEQIGEFDALIVRSATKVTKEIIESGAEGRLKIVGRAGVGVDNIDVDAASENGIVVKSAPYGNTNATAELALALMLDVSRKIPQAHYSLKNGIWKKKPFEGLELTGKTLGIIGCGRIGQRLSELVLGFNMSIIGYDTVIKPDSRIKYVSKEDVLTRSDYISIHVGGKEVIIGKKEISLMKPTVYLINTSRGPNVDEKALYEALATGRIAGAALDVYEEEPKEDGEEFSNRVRELENVIFSPHLGASTKEAQTKTSIEMARVVADYLLKGDFSSAVNVGEGIESEERPLYRLYFHHRDVPGIFAQIDSVLAENGINIRENSSRQIGKGNAITVYLLLQEVSLGIMNKLNRIKGVYRAWV